MSRAERRRFVLLGAAIAGLHLLGWVGVWWGVGHGAPALTGLAGLAYAFGLRHAFDADHIAAIDNATRRLMPLGRRPLAMGFAFSLGHSTVVFLLTLAVAIATQAMTQQMPALRAWGAVVGTTVAGVFLCAIGLLNLGMTLDIARAMRRLRRHQAGAVEVSSLERELVTRGFGGVFRIVTRPRQMYLMGFLFGLGFDTATEIGLLTTAALATSQDMPIAAVLSLPVVFAAGMCLMDTIDGVLMCGAYAWAYAYPLRKAFYNLTITGMSAAFALVIGVVELASVFSADGWWSALGRWNPQALGVGLLALSLIVWVASAGLGRPGSFEES